MNLRTRLLSVLLVCCMLISVFLAGLTTENIETVSLFNKKETVYFWYTDETLSDYLNSMALTFNEANGARVIPVLVSGSEYLESINDASLNTQTFPDLYITSNDSLEKAYLAGLAVPIEGKDLVQSDAFSEPAKRAVCYKDQLVGYPYYYETSALLYNKTYMEDLAKTEIESEADVAAAEAAMADLESGEEVPTDQTDTPATVDDASSVSENTASVSENGAIPQEEQAEIEARVPQLIPATFDDILTFADEYDAPEQVEAVFKWDVSDIFYNYFFVGNYINVGGECGDDTSDIDIYNLDAIKCLKIYQDLNQFFSIDTKEVEYDNIIQEFIEGKLVFTIATTDAIAKIEEAKKEGKFTYDYGITTLPDLNDTLQSKSLSVTNAIVINGYSQKKELANQFAEFLTSDNAASLYKKTGKIAANTTVQYDNENINQFMVEYADSVPMPKMMATSNFWVKMEIAFTKIWTGSSVTDQLKALSEQIMTQVTGKAYEEEYIAEPELQTETVQYLDEEAEKEAAQQEAGTVAGE